MEEILKYKYFFRKNIINFCSLTDGSVLNLICFLQPGSQGYVENSGYSNAANTIYYCLQCAWCIFIFQNQDLFIHAGGENAGSWDPSNQNSGNLLLVVFINPEGFPGENIQKPGLYLGMNRMGRYGKFNGP